MVNIKTATIFLLFFTLIVSCGDDSKNVSERLLKGEFSAYESLPEVPCDSLTLDSLDNTYKVDDTVFTGVCFTSYHNTNSRLEKRQIFEGKLHGNRILYSPKGDTLSVNLYNHGKLIRESIGEREVCHCDSLETREVNEKELKFYFDEPYTGRCKKYYPEDSTALYIEASYREGLPHGEMKVYSLDGEVIMSEKFSEGEKID